MKGGLLAFFTILWQVASFAQTLPIKVYSNEENSPVFVTGNILQDPQGMMWFVEKKTITKYDGAKFQTIECASNSRFPDDVFHRIYLFQGTLHILAEEHLYTVKNDSIVVIQCHNQQPIGVKNVIVDRAGNRYFMASDGLYHLVNNQWQPFMVDNALSLSDAKSGYVYLEDNHVVTYAYGKSLFIIDLKSKTFQQYSKPILDLQRYKEHIYLLTTTGILQMNFAKNDRKEPTVSFTDFAKISIPAAKLNVLSTDLEGNLWVTAQFEALIKITPDGTVTYFKEQSGMPSLWISEIYADRENNIWMSYYPGICKLSANKQRAYSIAEGLYSPLLTGVLKDEAHHSFLVLSPKGTNRICNHKVTKITDLKGNALISKYIYIQKNLLYSIEKDGFYRYKIEQDFISQKKRISILSNYLNCTILEKYNQIFVASGPALYHLRDDKLVLVREFDRVIHEAVADEWDNLWLLMGSNYLHKVAYDFTTDTVKTDEVIDLRKILKDPTELKGRNVMIDSNFDLWVVSSSRYLLKYSRPNTWEKVSIYDSTSKGADIWKACEFNKELYVVSNNGLYKFPLRGKRGNIIELKSITNISASRDIAALDNTQICIEKFPGVLLLDTDSSTIYKPHQVSINAIYINGKKYPNPQQHLDLNYLQNNITFEFSSNSYIDESNNRFRFQLSGDKQGEWSPTSKANTVNFSALSPGNYQLKIVAFNTFGIRSENIANFSFTIQSVFWKSNWFLSLLFIALLIIISILYWYRFQQLKHIQLVRNTISRDLHDHLGSSVSSISMLSKIASVKSSRSESIHGILEQIGKTATDAGENIDDIIWSINPKNDTLEATFIRIRNSVSELLESADIAYVINLQNASKKSFDTNLRRDVYMICKEAFANVVKYSRADKATLDISLEANTLSIKITDNGVGFELQRVLSGTRNGVKNIIQRVKSYKKGTIQIDSGIDKGTTIKIQLPIKNGTNML